MPLLEMIRRWLFEGHLPKSEGGRIPKGPEDISTGDFFITASPHSQGVHSTSLLSSRIQTRMSLCYRTFTFTDVLIRQRGIKSSLHAKLPPSLLGNPPEE